MTFAPHYNFAIGADINQRSRFFTFVDTSCQYSGHGIGAHETGNQWQKTHTRKGDGLEEAVLAGEHHRQANRGRIRGEANISGINSDKDVMHASVADHHQLVNVGGVDAGTRTSFRNIAVQGADNLGTQAVSSVAIMQSELGREGPTYTPVRVMELMG